MVMGAGRRPTARCDRVVAELNADWERIMGERHEVASWVEQHQALAGCGDLGGVLQRIAVDPRLGARIPARELRHGSESAVRVVLQAMLAEHADDVAEAG